MIVIDDVDVDECGDDDDGVKHYEASTMTLINIPNIFMLMRMTMECHAANSSTR